jgi:hypothetical protein
MRIDDRRSDPFWLHDRGDAEPGPEPPPKPEGDDVLYVGMNCATTEGGALARQAHARVTVLVGGTSSTVGGADLSTREGVEAFAGTLGLPQSQATEVALAILGNDVDGRDELARIALAWAPAEHGQRIPSRLVLSGHGGTEEIFGDTTGTLAMAQVAALARSMPRAAAQIEDVFLSACFQAKPGRIQKLLDAFPNAATVQGYEDFAPANDVTNILRWEDATRGHAERTIALPLGGAWTRHAGFSSREIPLDAALSEVVRHDVFDAYFRGDAIDRDPHRGPLATYYQALQRVSGRSDVPPETKRIVDQRILQTLALRFFPETRVRFARTHGAALRIGCAQLGVPVPDFARLDRKQANDAIADAARHALASGRSSPEIATTLRLLLGLRDLDPRVAPYEPR